jgi:hypothetical protein
MTPDQAIGVAKANEPSDPDEWSSEAQNIGLRTTMAIRYMEGFSLGCRTSLFSDTKILQ